MACTDLPLRIKVEEFESLVCSHVSPWCSRGKRAPALSVVLQSLREKNRPDVKTDHGHSTNTVQGLRYTKHSHFLHLKSQVLHMNLEAFFWRHLIQRFLNFTKKNTYLRQKKRA